MDLSILDIVFMVLFIIIIVFVFVIETLIALKLESLENKLQMIRKELDEYKQTQDEGE